MTYYVIETQTRTDGIVNQSMTARSNFASGNSLYYDRMSKLVMNTDYPSASLLLVDEKLNRILPKTGESPVVKTSYVAPVTDEEQADV